MLGFITPNAYFESVCHIPIAILEENGIRVLLFDLDNTITTWNSPELDVNVKQWFQQLNQSGIKGCILSNNSAERITSIAEALGIQYVARAKKPLPGGYKRAMIQMKSDCRSTIMVGDQLFTDMLGAHLAGIACFLVQPISLEHEFTGTRINRKMERMVMKPVIKKMKKRQNKR